MVFPLDVTTELLLDGVWTDITGDVYQRDPVTVVRGRSNEAAQAEPSRCNLTVDNRDGKYSPRNPTGTHFGKLGRNTQARVLTPGTAENHMALPGNYQSFTSTPDHASLDITGDIDIRVDLEPLTWRPTNGRGLARKYVTTDNQRSWDMTLWIDGTLDFGWSPDGTSGAVLFAASTVAIPAASTRLAVRVTLDVNNGAAGHDVRFYTAPNIAGPWTQLGATVTTAGTTSIFASTAEVEVGRSVQYPSQGKVYAAEIYNGIAGTLVASPDFTAADSGDVSLTDAQGRVWTLAGNAVMTNPQARFHGAVSAWPPRWDTSGTDVYTPVQADGIMRRLGQGAAALKSVLYRALTTDVDDVVAYWPCEDDAGATEFASALPGHPPMTFTGTAEVASFTDFKASAAIPVAGAAQWTGTVPTYTGTGFAQVRFLMAVPVAGVGAEATVCRVRTDGTAPRWDLSVLPAGTLRLRIFDVDDVLLTDSGVLGFSVNGKLLRVSIELTQDGSAVDWAVVTLEAGEGSGLVASGTQASRTVGRAVRVGMNMFGDLDGDGVALGHVSVQSAITSIFDLWGELAAWAGETVTNRVLRLCREESIPVTLVGNINDVPQMGPQLPRTLLDLLREAAAADMGILFEPREFFGLAYRTRASMYAQDAALALDYAASHLSSIDPVEDDQGTRNDITVKREGGSSARVELTEGSLSTAAPPDGVGRYDEEVTVNLETDAQLPDQAGWRLHAGTVDEARFPVLAVNLARSGFTASASLTADAEALDVGDRVTVENPPAWLPPDDISQLAQGFTETLTRFEWRIDVNCAPAAAWDAVGRWDDSSGPGEARYSSDGSTLAASLTTTATSMSVSTPTGPLWSDADQPYDLYVGGERMTVTGVTGTSSPQTFTVTRSVNGVVKTHAAGAEIRLFHPVVYAL